MVWIPVWHLRVHQSDSVLRILPVVSHRYCPCWHIETTNSSALEGICSGDSRLCTVELQRYRWFWFCNRVTMLVARTDFPAPGDPRPLTFLGSLSISLKIASQAPFIRGSQRAGSPRALIRSSNFSSSAIFTSFTRMVDTTNQIIQIMGIETSPWSAVILSLKPSSLFRNSFDLSFWARMYLTETNQVR